MIIINNYVGFDLKRHVLHTNDFIISRNLCGTNLTENTKKKNENCMQTKIYNAFE